MPPSGQKGIQGRFLGRIKGGLASPIGFQNQQKRCRRERPNFRPFRQVTQYTPGGGYWPAEPGLALVPTKEGTLQSPTQPQDACPRAAIHQPRESPRRKRRNRLRKVPEYR